MFGWARWIRTSKWIQKLCNSKHLSCICVTQSESENFIAIVSHRKGPHLVSKVQHYFSPDQSHKFIRFRLTWGEAYSYSHLWVKAVPETATLVGWWDRLSNSNVKQKLVSLIRTCTLNYKHDQNSWTFELMLRYGRITRCDHIPWAHLSCSFLNNATPTFNGYKWGLSRAMHTIH